MTLKAKSVAYGQTGYEVLITVPVGLDNEAEKIFGLISRCLVCPDCSDSADDETEADDLHDDDQAAGFKAQWARIELLGHRTIYCIVSEVELFGKGMMQLEIPEADGTFRKEYYSPDALYGIRPMTSEQVAQFVHQRNQEAIYLLNRPVQEDYDGDEPEDDGPF